MNNEMTTTPTQAEGKMPIAWLVYLPSEETQRVYDSQEDSSYVDDLTNNPDAEITPLYAHPAPTELSGVDAQPAADVELLTRDWKAINAAIDEYADGYELRGEPGDHTPTEFERFVIVDAINGLLAEPEFMALIASPVAAQKGGEHD